MEVRDEIFDAEQMGEQLKKLRNSLRLSQEKFAERLGMSRDTIYNYEKGKTAIYLLILLTFPYFQGFPPLKILYMYPFPLFLPLWDNYKGKFIIQLFNRCLPLYQEVLRKSALLPL